MIELVLAFLLSLWPSQGHVNQGYGSGIENPPSPPPDTTGIGGDTGHIPPKLP